MKDKCGVFGIALDSKDVALPIYYGLYALQHRGQESPELRRTTLHAY